jgi:hypothetical protein
MKKSSIGAVIAAGMLVFAFAGTALAGGTHTWDGQGVENGDVDHNCDGLEPGELLWIFTGDPVLPATLNINGNGYSGSQGGGPNSSWHFVTPWFDLDPDVTDASIDYVNDGQLTISHGCPAETTTTTSSESTSTSSEETTTEETTTEESSTTEETTETGTVSETTSSSESSSTDTTTTATTTTNTPSGTVDAATGKPNSPKATPPATDALASTSSPSDSSWQLFLLGAAGVLAGILLVKPASAKARKR